MKKVSKGKQIKQHIQKSISQIRDDDIHYHAYHGEGCSVFDFPSIQCGPDECDENGFPVDNWQHIYIAFEGNNHFTVWQRVTEYCHKILASDLSLRRAIKIAYKKQRNLQKFIAPPLRAYE